LPSADEFSYRAPPSRTRGARRLSRAL